METLYELETFKVRLKVSEPETAQARSPQQVQAILRPIYADLDADQEHFTVLLLNNKNYVRAHKLLSSGSQTASLVHPSIVFRYAVLFGACALVLAHNHPCGILDPSQEDMDITRRIMKCGELFGIRVLDHIILGNGLYYSMSDHGLMDESPNIRPAETDKSKHENIRFYLWRKKIKRKAIAAALNQPYGYLCRTLRGYREVEAELDAIAKYLETTKDHLKLLIEGKAPRTEPL